MKTLVSVLLLVSAASTRGSAQDCLGMTFKSGMGFELSTFNGKDKPTGKIMYQVKDVHKEGSSTIMDITAQFQDEKGNQRSPYSIHYTCTGNELVADMSGMMLAMPTAGMKDSELKLKTNKLIYPGKMSVGQKLSDGQMEAEMTTDGNTMLNMNMMMVNRLVDSKEPVTTSAGTFDTYKITSDVNLDNKVMGIPVRSTMRVVSYRTDKQLFDVKSETYNKNGKLMGYTLLTKTY